MRMRDEAGLMSPGVEGGGGEGEIGDGRKEDGKEDGKNKSFAPETTPQIRFCGSSLTD